MDDSASLLRPIVPYQNAYRATLPPSLKIQPMDPELTSGVSVVLCHKRSSYCREYDFLFDRGCYAKHFFRRSCKSESMVWKTSLASWSLRKWPFILKKYKYGCIFSVTSDLSDQYLISLIEISVGVWAVTCVTFPCNAFASHCRHFKTINSQFVRLRQGAFRACIAGVNLSHNAIKHRITAKFRHFRFIQPSIRIFLQHTALRSSPKWEFSSIWQI